MGDHIHIRESSYSSFSETISQITTDSKTELSVGVQESTNAGILHNSTDVYWFWVCVTSHSRSLSISVDPTELLTVNQQQPLLSPIIDGATPGSGNLKTIMWRVPGRPPNTLIPFYF